MVRLNTAYHPKLLFKKYKVIDNNFWSKILIDQSNPGNIRNKNKKEHRNKLLIVGLIFYVIWMMLAILIALNLFSESINEAISLIFATIAMIFHVINTKNTDPKPKDKTDVKIINVIYVTTLVIFTVAIIAYVILLFIS